MTNLIKLKNFVSLLKPNKISLKWFKAVKSSVHLILFPFQEINNNYMFQMSVVRVKHLPPRKEKLCNHKLWQLENKKNNKFKKRVKKWNSWMQVHRKVFQKLALIKLVLIRVYSKCHRLEWIMIFYAKAKGQQNKKNKVITSNQLLFRIFTI